MTKHKAVVGVINMDQIYKQLDRLETAPEKALEATLKDFRTTAPIWVAEAVISQYNIAKAEVKPKKKGERKLKTGHIKVRGKTIGDMAIVYVGRPLTITHFLKATKRPGKHPGTGTTTVSAKMKFNGKAINSKGKKITKKQRQNIGRNFTGQGTRNSPKSPLMMLYTGNKQPGGTNYIPFGRQSQSRDDLKPFKTVSLPQMVRHKETEEKINKAIEIELGKRFEHHITRFMPVERK